MNAPGRWFTCLLIAALLLSSLGAAPERVVRADQPPSAEASPLAGLLLPDGTLDLTTGFSGSLDVSGYRMVGAPGEAPRFVPEAAGDERWSAAFQRPGTSTLVHALAVIGSDLYVGGDFDYAGGVFAPRVARWDGTVWSAIGPTMGGYVFALAASGPVLYVGGYFTQAGGIPANNVARYDTATGTWSALGSGVGQYVQALAVDSSGNLYAGGTFTTPASYVAVWDGASWSALGSGMNNLVQALVADGTALYAGGHFTAAGGNAASHVARWDGSAWSPLDSGTDSTVFALAVSGGTLYAGGAFTTAGGVSANRVARWDGSAWSSLGSGLGGPGQSVRALAMGTGGRLYASGDFATPAGYVAQWDGSTWSSMGVGLSSMPEALALVSGTLYAGGQFTGTGNLSLNYIARWDGSAWNPLGWGTWGYYMDIWALAADGSGNLYAGGRFTSPATFVARWDGSRWSPLGSGMNSWVYTLALDGSGNLYAGGDFTTAGGVAANRVAKWNGTAWSSLGTGMDSSVFALAVDQSGNLYAGGYFTTAGGVPANYVAKWNGSAWSALGSGMNGGVEDLVVDASGNLFAGGLFSNAGGVTVQYVGKWNGSAWSSLAGGMNSGVWSLALDAGGDLYAGGDFTAAGGVGANRVARWDGSAWSALGSGTDGRVQALALDGEGSLYAGGAFASADGVTVNYVARWKDNAWTALGSGTNGMVQDVAFVDAKHLYAGGQFTTAGLKPSSGIGRWERSLYDGWWDPTGYCMDPPPNVNTGHVARCSGEYIWKDAQDDERTDAWAPYSNADLRELRVTGDSGYIYFRARLADITDTARPYLAFALDSTLDTGGMDWLGDVVDTQVHASAKWEREIVVNLNKTGYYDTSWTWHDAGTSYISPVDDTIEIRMPWSELGTTPPAKLRFSALLAQNDAGGTYDIYGSDVLDAVTWTGPNTWDEVGDGILDYYFDVWFSDSGEVYSPLLITGVLADGPGSPECEWVRLTDTSGLTLPLLNWKIGDEETKGAGEGMKSFGDVTISSGSILLANNLDTCSCGFTADLGFGTMASYSVWGSGSVALANAGDEVLLLDDRDTVMDAVTWGAGGYASVSPHVASAENHYLDRVPANVDTNNCADDFDDVTGPCPPQPTMVELASFTARAEPGLVRVTWETLSEIDNAGFNVLRSEAADGEYAQLNAGLIPAQGGPTQPASYTYDDAEVTDGVTYYYRLEAVDLQGKSQLFGPVHATAGMWHRVHLPTIVR